MTHADDMISRAFPEAERVRWGFEEDHSWLTVVWASNPLIQHTESTNASVFYGSHEESADDLIKQMQEYRSTRLVAQLLDIVRRECKRP